MTSQPRSGAPDRSRPTVLMLLTLLVLLAVTAGCTSTPERAPEPGPSLPEGTSGPDAGTGSGTGPVTGEAPGGEADRVPAARRTEPPPWVTRPRITRPPADGASDPLAADTGGGAFPRPADLGPGWTYRGSFGEPGYVDGPAPVRRLDPRDAVRETVPRGCPVPVTGPTRASGRGSSALQAVSVAYAVSGDWVDATRITFAAPRAATGLARDRRRALVSCRGSDGGSSLGPLVTRVQALGAGATLSDRTPRSDAYADVALVDGRSLVVVTRRTEEQPTLRAARALAAAFAGTRVPGGLS